MENSPVGSARFPVSVSLRGPTGPWQSPGQSGNLWGLPHQPAGWFAMTWFTVPGSAGWGVVPSVFAVRPSGEGRDEIPPLQRTSPVGEGLDPPTTCRSPLCRFVALARQRPRLPLSGELDKIFDFGLRGSFLSLRHGLRRATSLIRGRHGWRPAGRREG